MEEHISVSGCADRVVRLSSSLTTTLLCTEWADNAKNAFDRGHRLPEKGDYLILVILKLRIDKLSMSLCSRITTYARARLCRLRLRLFCLRRRGTQKQDKRLVWTCEKVFTITGDPVCARVKSLFTQGPKQKFLNYVDLSLFHT